MKKINVYILEAIFALRHDSQKSECKVSKNLMTMAKFYYDALYPMLSSILRWACFLALLEFSQISLGL